MLKKHLIGTHLLLVRWGKWGAGPNLGLPSMSPMFGERALKTALYSYEEPNPEIALIDKAVGQITEQRRSIIVKHYASRWSIRKFMREYGWSQGRAYNEIDRSVEAVDSACNKLLTPDTVSDTTYQPV